MNTKAVMIACNMILNDEVAEMLKKLGIRGFTRWDEVKGKGSDKGEPHLGSHIWPALNSTFLAVVDEEKVDPLFSELKEIEKTGSQQGIRAFVWSIEKAF